MTETFRACIHAIKTNEEEISAPDILVLEEVGLESIRVYGGQTVRQGVEGRFLILKFQLATTEDIFAIKTTLAKYAPIYCFNEICPQDDLNCPAYTR
jgi:hypothetical protein